MKKIKKRKMEYPGTIISAYISIDAFDKLEELCEIYGKSRSRMIEAMIRTIYEVEKEKEKERAGQEMPERTEQAQSETL
jgi:metal-responsive CopG/Arc/MetJ family transcriptional regulator